MQVYFAIMYATRSSLNIPLFLNRVPNHLPNYDSEFRPQTAPIGNGSGLMKPLHYDANKEHKSATLKVLEKVARAKQKMRYASNFEENLVGHQVEHFFC
jgi:hypothetical protein